MESIISGYNFKEKLGNGEFAEIWKVEEVET